MEFETLFAQTLMELFVFRLSLLILWSLCERVFQIGRTQLTKLLLNVILEEMVLTVKVGGGINDYS